MKRSAFVVGVLVAGLLVAAAPGGATTLTVEDAVTFGRSGVFPSDRLVDYGWGDVNRIDGFGDHVAWAHLFDSSLGTPESVELSLWLVDNELDKTRQPWTKELAVGLTNDGQWLSIGEVDTYEYPFTLGVSSVKDGSVTVGLAGLGGDFRIEKSILAVNYQPAPVPEPGTLILLGSGLLGVAGCARRKKQG